MRFLKILSLPLLQNNGWQDAFDAMVTYEDVTRLKPDPEPYLRAMAKLGAMPEQTLVFEDSTNGLNSAKAAGALAVGVKTGSAGQKLDIADVVLDDLTQVVLEKERNV